MTILTVRVAWILPCLRSASEFAVVYNLVRNSTQGRSVHAFVASAAIVALSEIEIWKLSLYVTIFPSRRLVGTLKSR